MNVGFVIPSFPNERRVALLPDDIQSFQDQLYIEKGFGRNLKIQDEEYKNKGCIIAEREEIFSTCPAIFCLKLLQACDYDYIQQGQMIVGWTHPTGSGVDFMARQAIPKNLRIVDLDNISPRIYVKDKVLDINWIPRNFIAKNSFNAGVAATLHAFICYGALPSEKMNIAVLGSGNTAQGICYAIAKFTSNYRMFYRKTISEFYDQISDFDVIVNGIEIDTPNLHIVSKQNIQQTKRGCYFIDAAADAGNTIEGTHYTSIDNPIYEDNERYYYVVNNAPSLIYRYASCDISRQMSKYIFRQGFGRLV